MNPSSGLIVYPRSDWIDAIDQYTRRLLSELRAAGADADYYPDGIDDALARYDGTPAWILVQYNPFRYGRGGVALQLPLQARRLRRLGAPLAVMVHETWIDIVDARSAAISIWQRAQLRDLLRGADAVMTSTEAFAAAIGGGAVHVPVPSNIEPIRSSHDAARERLGLDRRLVVALFGRGHPSRALDHAEAAIAALAEAHGPDALTVLNLGAGAPPVRVPAGVETQTPGPLAEDALSLRLWASDLVLLPFSDGLSTRRGTLMAALAHARPVLGLGGVNTERILADTLAVTPVGDLETYARAAVDLCSDRERLTALAEAGAHLYTERFDWPIVADTVGGILREMPTRRSRAITFVAHDVGGAGGMERHTDELIGRLLDAGRPVTVVARTCRVAPRPGLAFRRVPVPRRPFALSYPAFFVLGSLMLSRRRDPILHTTGAVVANRADVITVHYCHHAGGARDAGSRASRPGALYGLNQTVSSVLSRVAESWCYRPARARLLCAVSSGVEDELELAFPKMASQIRSIPNGVDAARFAPDPSARRGLRDQLGVAPESKIALFAGGDWERKGLRFAVGALADAQEWHLAVAGDGDPGPLLASSSEDGTADRLHFLGRVEDMPALYAAADAFVFPTSYEAFPLVVLEAAASAVPMLVTRVNGATELIDHGQNGWFIERNADDIAKRLNELLADPDRGRSMAARARETAGSFTWDAMADAYASLYAELVDAGDR